MAKFGMYAVYDCLAEEYSPPFTQKTVKSAFRAYEMMLSNGKLSKDDYHLYHVGYFHSDSGVLDSITPCIVDEKVVLDAISSGIPDKEINHGV